MKKIIFILTFLLILISIFSLDLTKNYVQVYGEGPKGRIPVKFEPVRYSEKDTVLLARTEIFEFLSGIIYGYTFVYHVENPLLKEKGHFDLTHICHIGNQDPNVSVSQLEEATQFMRIQATYRLNEDQKLYINGFRTKAGQMSMGKGEALWDEQWENRIKKAYKNALQNAVLNSLKKEIQSRPQFITGKILLRNCPTITLSGNHWLCSVQTDIIIDDIQYRESY